MYRKPKKGDKFQPKPERYGLMGKCNLSGKRANPNRRKKIVKGGLYRCVE